MQKSVHFLALFIACVLFVLPSCRPPQAPTLQGISKFRVNRKNAERKVQFQLGLDLFNPNRFKIKILSYDLDVFVNGKKIGEAQLNRKIVLKKESPITMEFAVQTDLQKVLGGIFGLLKSYTSGKDLEMRIKGTVKARAHGINKTLEIDLKKPISL